MPRQLGVLSPCGENDGPNLKANAQLLQSAIRFWTTSRLHSPPRKLQYLFQSFARYAYYLRIRNRPELKVKDRIRHR